jgi:hypothetical protein
MRVYSQEEYQKLKQAKAMPAKPASVGDPYGLQRLERSQAQTEKGYTRLANSIMRDAIGNPLTRHLRSHHQLLPPRAYQGNVSR